MKEALFTTAGIAKAKSLTQGGSVISAQNADYDTYAKELIVCPYCSSPVFLKAKYSELREPHWSHFPGTGIQCVAKSQPKLLKLKFNKEAEKQFRKQCLAIWKTKLTNIFMMSYGQENLNKLEKELILAGKTPMEAVSYIANSTLNKYLPKFKLSSWQHKVFPLLKNVSAITEIIDIFFEEILTNPKVTKGAEDLIKSKKNSWDSSFTFKLINSSFTPQEMLLHRSILIELVKYFATTESIDIFQLWFNFNLVQVFHYDFRQIETKLAIQELWSKYTPEKTMLLHSLYNLCLIDWVGIFNQIRLGLKPEVYVISLANVNIIKDYLYLVEGLKPINIASIKGFGK
jgi:DNA-directed RNA polymerase subunit RPC12/RpoP